MRLDRWMNKSRNYTFYGLTINYRKVKRPMPETVADWE